MSEEKKMNLSEKDGSRDDSSVGKVTKRRPEDTTPEGCDVTSPGLPNPFACPSHTIDKDVDSCR